MPEHLEHIFYRKDYFSIKNGNVSKKNIQAFKMGYFVYLSKNKIQ